MTTKRKRKRPTTSDGIYAQTLYDLQYGEVVSIIPITNSNEIKQHLGCKLCDDERPADASPTDWQRLSVGFTKIGLQVWCLRHEYNVVHIDFEGHKHPANVGRKKTEAEKGTSRRKDS